MPDTTLNMATSQVPVLPDEILSMICEQLGNDKDYVTLYKCALSCQSLADPALRTLYQYHEQSPAFIQSEEMDTRQRVVAFDKKLKQAELIFRKWTLIWRSIIASSLPEMNTYKPYCRYLRILDFRNLVQMLDDPKFQNTVKRDFFKGGLEHLHFPIQEGRRQWVDIVATINAIGEAVVPKTFLLEEISGNLSPGFLARWITLTPKLRNMVLFQGEALMCDAGIAVANHCENFESLTIREWRGALADTECAKFLTSIQKHTLQYFEMISYNDLQKVTFKALGTHQLLQQLKLSNLSTEAVENLNALKHCTNLHTLVLEDNFGTTQLEALNNDVFVEVVQWLSSCDKLRDLTLKGFLDGPAILARVCSAPQVRLAKLALEGYVVRAQASPAFHTALAEQKTLESISLRGSGEDATPDDLAIMVEALAQLDNLRELVLKDVSDEFEESHILTLALSLQNLEELWTSGQYISSEILPCLANLKNLKMLTLFAMTQFSADAILEFLTQLDPETQRGFNLSLMAADPENGDLQDEEQEIIQTFIKQNLEGRFDFALWRDNEESDSDDE